MATLSRGFKLNRAFVADRWLQEVYGTTVGEATEDQLSAFLRTIPPEMREQTLDALVAYEDDLVRKGQLPRNIARTIRLP